MHHNSQMLAGCHMVSNLYRPQSRSPQAGRVVYQGPPSSQDKCSNGPAAASTMTPAHGKGMISQGIGVGGAESIGEAAFDAASGAGRSLAALSLNLVGHHAHKAAVLQQITAPEQANRPLCTKPPIDFYICCVRFTLLRARVQGTSNTPEP